MNRHCEERSDEAIPVIARGRHCERSEAIPHHPASLPRRSPQQSCDVRYAGEPVVALDLQALTSHGLSHRNKAVSLLRPEGLAMAGFASLRSQ